MHHLRRAVRRVVAYALYYSGFLWLYAALRLRRQAVVLMYHRVLPADADTFSHEGIIVSPEIFDMHMSFLARHFRALTLSQFKQELAASSFRGRACLVTFDDGWLDNLEHALPTLRKHDMPAVVFVATGYIGTGDTFWQERLTRLLCVAAAHPGRATDLLREAGLDRVAHANPDQVRRRAREFVTTLKSREPAAALQMIERLQAALNDIGEALDPDVDRFMTWDDLHELRRSGLVTIGSHARSHSRLTTLGYKRARAELEASSRDLAEHGLTDVTACAYPNGDVNDPVEAAATDAGFELGFGTKPGLVAHSSEAMHLRRINIHESDARTRPEFFYRILGLP